MLIDGVRRTFPFSSSDFVLNLTSGLPVAENSSVEVLYTNPPLSGATAFVTGYLEDA